MNKPHSDRIKEELRRAGVSSYGMRKFSIRYLPKIIDKDEHIRGVVYGRYTDSMGTLKYNAGSLVATDKRVMFIDHKPGLTIRNDLIFESITGVKLLTAIFSNVTLYTKQGDFNLRFVNPNCAKIFVKYIESINMPKRSGGKK